MHSVALPAKPLHPVQLVGAGPGDPELLTLKAARAIAEADVIFVDDLVHPDVLQHASRTCRIVHVGKRGGCLSTPQRFIEKAMVREAKAGLRVLRLKGGDPFIFGRGGEEVEHLQAQGLAVQVVPGITASMGAMASLNTPLTHRSCAQGVVFVTGHMKSDPSGQSALDWAALGASAAQQHLTLVIYMGVRTLSAIVEGLRVGLAADTPVAVVQHATWAEQRHVACTLAELTDVVARHGLGSPAVLVIGEVTRGLLALAQGADTVVERVTAEPRRVSL